MIALARKAAVAIVPILSLAATPRTSRIGLYRLAGSEWRASPGRRASDAFRIERPRVDARLSSYPDHRFQAGDRISVRAGGCVKVGGKWRPYVDPYVRRSDRQSARLFHGLIWIPGATPGAVRIASLVGKTVKVPESIQNTEDVVLRLGYEADDGKFPQNAYDGAPVGDGCTEAAWVEIQVNGDTPSAQPSAMDLQWTAMDDNWIPLRPTWQWQVDHPGLLLRYPVLSHIASPDWSMLPAGVSGGPDTLPTTQSPSLDFNDWLVAPICKDGPHLNWFPATYSGRLFYTGGDNYLSDHDLDFVLLPLLGSAYDASGLTYGNIRNGDMVADARGGGVGFHVEFDRDETLRRMSGAEGWWATFTKAGAKDKKALVNGADALLTGLYGLDCEHFCQTELHPVWAFAIREQGPPGMNEEEVWAVFARTFGNEGGCSQGSSIPAARTTNFSHYLDLPNNTLKIRLPVPWSSGATVTLAGFKGNTLANGAMTVSPSVTTDASTVLVAIPFGAAAPEQRPFVYGEVHLRRRP